MRLAQSQNTLTGHVFDWKKLLQELRFSQTTSLQKLCFKNFVCKVANWFLFDYYVSQIRIELSIILKILIDMLFILFMSNWNYLSTYMYLYACFCTDVCLCAFVNMSSLTHTLLQNMVRETVLEDLRLPAVWFHSVQVPKLQTCFISIKLIIINAKSDDQCGLSHRRQIKHNFKLKIKEHMFYIHKQDNNKLCIAKHCWEWIACLVSAHL